MIETLPFFPRAVEEVEMKEKLNRRGSRELHGDERGRGGQARLRATNGDVGKVL